MLEVDKKGRWFQTVSVRSTRCCESRHHTCCDADRPEVCHERYRTGSWRRDSAQRQARVSLTGRAAQQDSADHGQRRARRAMADTTGAQRQPRPAPQSDIGNGPEGTSRHDDAHEEAVAAYGRRNDGVTNKCRIHETKLAGAKTRTELPQPTSDDDSHGAALFGGAVQRGDHRGREERRRCGKAPNYFTSSVRARSGQRPCASAARARTTDNVGSAFSSQRRRQVCVILACGVISRSEKTMRTASRSKNMTQIMPLSFAVAGGASARLGTF